jgi:hypothetical protein
VVGKPGGGSGTNLGNQCSSDEDCCSVNDGDCEAAILSSGWFSLGAVGLGTPLSLFNTGPNSIVWQVYNGAGPSGFYGEMVACY